MKVFVTDVTEISFCGYHSEEFDSLSSAFEYVEQEISECSDERHFEIHLDHPSSSNWINIDARSFQLEEEEAA